MKMTREMAMGDMTHSLIILNTLLIKMNQFKIIMKINNLRIMCSSNLKNHCQLLIFNHIQLKIVRNKDLKCNNRCSSEIKWGRSILIDLFLS